MKMVYDSLKIKLTTCGDSLSTLLPRKPVRSDGQVVVRRYFSAVATGASLKEKTEDSFPEFILCPWLSGIKTQAK